MQNKTIEYKFAFLKEHYLTQALKCVQKTVLKHGDNIDELTRNIKVYNDEFDALLKNRKYLLLNTNVVKNNTERILKNETIRSFYFDLYASLVIRVSLDYSEDELKELFTLCLQALKLPGIFRSSNDRSLVPMTGEMAMYIGQHEVTREAIDFFKENPWYIGVIICSHVVSELIEDIGTLLSVQ